MARERTRFEKRKRGDREVHVKRNGKGIDRGREVENELETKRRVNKKERRIEG